MIGLPMRLRINTPLLALVVSIPAIVITACSLVHSDRDQLSNCNDGEMNGDETDIDCGGSCSPCGCYDGKQNGDETDTDCGGDCTPCSLTQNCLTHTDCSSRRCFGGICFCPFEDKGVKWQAVPTADNHSLFCMTNQEVSVANYEVFKNAVQGAGGSGTNGSYSFENLPEECVGNVVDYDYDNECTTETNSTEEGKASLPVRCVSWCDAVMFCQWARGRLCGHVNGEPLPIPIDDDSTPKLVNDIYVSEWYSACASSNSSARKFPYEGVFNPCYCNGEGFGSAECASDAGGAGGAGGASPAGGAGPDALCPVETAGDNCRSYYQVGDLSGNVAEWTNACGSSGENRGCLVRGGDYTSMGESLTCEVPVEDPKQTPVYDSKQGYPTVGIRCCYGD